jgi:multidrug efflux pump subunit AcrB
MVHYLLRPEMKLYILGEHGETAGGKGLIWRMHYAFNRQFERLRTFYISLLNLALDHRKMVLCGFLLFAFGSVGLVHFIGSDFFPTVDSGQLRLHARTPVGTRLEQAEVTFAQIEDEIRHVIPRNELGTVIDNIGIPNGGFNLAFGDNPTLGTGDGEILLSLQEKRSASTAEYQNRLRKRLLAKFPGVSFYFEAANITNQILNFGLPSPIDLQISSRNSDASYKLALQLRDKIARIPGAVDVHVHQVVDYPEIRVNVDRNKAGQVGLSQADVANSLLISLSGTSQIAPAQWLNWNTGVQYQIGAQTPQRRIDSLDALMRTPIGTVGKFASGTADGSAAVGVSPNQSSLAYGNPGASPDSTQRLANVATTTRGVAPQIVNHYNVQPVFDVYANVERQDLGTVGTAVRRIMDETEKTLPKNITMDLRGQIATMETSFYRLGLGLIFALPGALAGILWMLFVTQTTFSVPSLMGAIMCIGVATANSILVVVFANDQRLEGMNERAAALAAGSTRIRPVMMTAAAMIIGMLPMALGIGEGGEQNSPLGRAVIGGLLLATVTTLFIVPVVYSLMRKKPPVDFDLRIEEEEREDISAYL